MTLNANDIPLFLLVLARVGGTVAVAPLLGTGLPVGLKAAVALALSVVYFPLIPHATSVPSGAGLIPALGGETAVGLAMGFAASLLFAAVQTAGAILDQELGLSMAAVLDPAGGEPVSLVAQFKLVFAGAAYLLIDGHHLLLSALADSYRAVPVLGFSFPAGAGPMVMGWGTAMLAFAVKVAAPALVAVLVVTIAAAFLSRVMPDAGVFVSSLPVRLMVGQVVLAAGTAAFVYGFASSVREGGDSMRVLLDSMGGRP